MENIDFNSCKKLFDDAIALSEEKGLDIKNNSVWLHYSWMVEKIKKQNAYIRQLEDKLLSPNVEQ